MLPFYPTGFGLASELDNFVLTLALTVALGGALILLVSLIYLNCFAQASVTLDSSFHIPGQYDAERAGADDTSEEEWLASVEGVERASYLQALEWCEANPSVLGAIGESYTPETIASIRLRGVDAFHFQPDLSGNFTVQDRTDVIFHNVSSLASSAVLNYALPVKTRVHSECTYFEVKLLEGPTSGVSIGLATTPYPGFRLPGYHHFSLAYEADGSLRLNKAFGPGAKVLPPLQLADVVGVGFKPLTGTVFVTHNGRKVMDVARDLRLDMYPVIGVAGAARTRLQVNLGGSGFVFIEANVKKWGFATAGNVGAPPVYIKAAGDEVLEKGAEIPPDYPEQEVTFFGPRVLVGSSTAPAPVPERPVESLDETPGEAIGGPDVFPREDSQGSSAPPKEAFEGSEALPVSSPPSYKVEEASTGFESSVSESQRELTERLYEGRSSVYAAFDLQEVNSAVEEVCTPEAPPPALSPVVSPVVSPAPSSPLSPPLDPVILESHEPVVIENSPATPAVASPAVASPAVGVSPAVDLSAGALNDSTTEAFETELAVSTPSSSKKAKGNKKKGKKGKKKGRSTF